METIESAYTPATDLRLNLTSSELPGQPCTSISGPVNLAVTKDAYHPGEIIEFVINNQSASDIYYTYGGCSRPIIYKCEDDERVSITVDITEEEPMISTLAPGQTQRCTWDQMAWQDPETQGSKRYRRYIESFQVPTGEYQL